MRNRVLAVFAAFLAFFTVSLAPAYAQSASYSASTLHFGDQTNWRPAPTTGTLTGTYRTKGPWVQTGPISCVGCRLFFGSSVTFNNTITGTAGVENNSGGMAGAIVSYGVWPNGGSGEIIVGYTPSQGPGAGATEVWDTQTGAMYQLAGGGSHGGKGGGSSPSTYGLEPFLAGSGGGNGPNGGGAGGAGFYVEAQGPVTFTSTATVHCDGANAPVQGGGGSGGGIDVRSLRLITVNSGAVLTANGGNGTTYGYAGGGGIISLMSGPGYSTVNAGTLQSNGGTGGAGVGAAGVLAPNATFTGPRVSF